MPKKPRRSGKIVEGYVAVTVDPKGEVCEFTDPCKSRRAALLTLSKRRSFMSHGAVAWVTHYCGNIEHLEAVLNARVKDREFPPQPQTGG